MKFLTEGGKGGTFGVNTVENEYLIRKQLLDMTFLSSRKAF